MTVKARDTVLMTALRAIGAAHRASFGNLCGGGAPSAAFDDLRDRTAWAVEAVLAGGLTPAQLHWLRPRGKRALRVWREELGEVLCIAQGARVRANPNAMSFWRA